MTVDIMVEPEPSTATGFQMGTGLGIGSLATTTSVGDGPMASPMSTGIGLGGAAGSGGGGSSIGGSQQLNHGHYRPRFDEDTELSLIKVVVLGARGVGKTSIVKVRSQAHFLF